MAVIEKLRRIGERLGQSASFKNMVLTGLGIGLFGISKVIYNTVILKYFGEATVGEYNVVLSLPMLLSIIVSNFSIVSLSKFASESAGKKDEQEVQSVMTTLLVGSLASSTLFAVLFFVYAQFVAHELNGNPVLFRQSAIVIIAYSLYSFFKSFSYVVNRVTQYIVFEVVGFILFLTTLFVCVTFRLREALLLPVIIQLSVISAMGITASARYLVFDIARLRQFIVSMRFREIARYSLITGLGTTASMSMVYLYTVVMSKFASIEDIGYYASVTSVLDPLNLLPRMISMVIFPRIAYHFASGDLKEIVGTIRKVDRYWFLLWFVIGAILIPLMPAFAQLLFGVHGEHMIVFIDLMLISRIIGFLGIFYVSLLSATKYPVIPNSVGPVALIVTLPLIPFAYQNGGLTGIGIILVIGSLIKILPIYFMGNKIFSKN